MIIKNAKVLDKDFKFIKADVLVKDTKITKIAERLDGEDIIDAKGCYLVPGFIDTHMHGALGETFSGFCCDTYKNIATFEASRGTTSLVPAISGFSPVSVPFSENRLFEVLEYFKKFYKKDIEGASELLGVHVEGPYLSPLYKGAFRPDVLRKPDKKEMQMIIDEGSDMIKIMTIAPETEGAKEIIESGVQNGISMSAGHTNASYEEVLKCADLGALRCTHLYNAMRPMNHRDSGAVGGFLSDDRINVELICDFFHISPEVLKITYKVKGKDKIIMITDSSMATGCPDGEYTYNGQMVFVKDGKPRLSDGTITGGTACLLDCVKNLVSIGIPLEDACYMASKNPAKSIGEYERKGSIEEGKDADMLILDKDLNLKTVILRGKIL